jgi:hypothetical protein
MHSNFSLLFIFSDTDCHLVMLCDNHSWEVGETDVTDFFFLFQPSTATTTGANTHAIYALLAARKPNVMAASFRFRAQKAQKLMQSQGWIECGIEVK